MGLGFVHGVMNTDNMALSGETIDYGPCAFMEGYAPGTVFSSIDRQGRYAWANQPLILGWNLARLAEALLPLIDPDGDKAVEIANDRLDGIAAPLSGGMAGRDARASWRWAATEPADAALVDDLLTAMTGADWTLTFHRLAEAATGDVAPAAVVRRFRGDGALAAALAARLAPDAADRIACQPTPP